MNFVIIDRLSLGFALMLELRRTEDIKEADCQPPDGHKGRIEE
jgi:hypothetical protein